MKKRRLYISIVLLFVLFNIQAQKAKKPTLMVVPSDAWCNQKGYMIEIENQGSITKVPNYKAAFQNDTDLLLVISTINGMMAKRGFPLKNLETEMKGLERAGAKNIVRSGPAIMESPMDQILKRANADIIVQLTWVVNGEKEKSPKRYVTYNLQGLDSYTYKQIATATGSGVRSYSADLPILLEEAVRENMDDFTNTLFDHFTDMFENGREVTLEILTTEDWDGDLDELAFEIEDWLDQNAKNGSYSSPVPGEGYVLFEQVRMPLFNEKGRALAARNFFRNLSKTLKAPPYNQPNTMQTDGLGKVTIILR